MTQRATKRIALGAFRFVRDAYYRHMAARPGGLPREWRMHPSVYADIILGGEVRHLHIGAPRMLFGTRVVLDRRVCGVQLVDFAGRVLDL